MKEFIKSIAAGIAISLGSMIYLVLNKSLVGAVFFTLGLFLVLTRGYNLYTGKVANVVDNKISYLIELIKMWLGNLVGAIFIVILTRLSKLSYLVDIAKATTQSKTSQGLLSAFIMAALCGFAIYYAVINYKENKDEFGKYLGLLFFIPLFIVCTFEHCVADMYYFILSGDISLNTIIYLLVITLGNSFGSILLRCGKKIIDK